MIAKLDEFKDAWRAIGRIAPERLSGLRRVATIESIGSSTRIEGAKLSDRDVERLLSNLDIRAFTGRDEQEVASYAAVMDTVFEHGKPLRWPRITSGSFTAISWSIRTSMNATTVPTRPYRTMSRPSMRTDAASGSSLPPSAPSKHRSG